MSTLTTDECSLGGDHDWERSEYDPSVGMMGSGQTCVKCGAWRDDADVADDYEPPEPDGECYRGGEYAASVAHDMAEARKLK